MILDTLANASRYSALHTLFPRAFEFLNGTDLKELPPGRHQIEGERLFAIVEAARGRTHDQAKLECHRKFIDIQLVLEGVDEMGWKPLHDCQKPLDDYNPERDIQFFHDSPSSWIVTQPGSFCIFFPDDAHAPLVGSGEIRKVILKIAAASL